MSVLSQTPQTTFVGPLIQNHNRKWSVCPTWHFLTDAVTYFSTCDVIKVKRTDSSRKQLSGRKPGQQPFVFRGSLSQWRGVGSGIKGGGGKRKLSLPHSDLNTQRLAAHTQSLKYWNSVCGQWTCVEAGSHPLSEFCVTRQQFKV